MGEAKATEKSTLSKKEARKAEKAARKVEKATRKADKKALKTKDEHETPEKPETTETKEPSTQAPKEDTNKEDAPAKKTKDLKSKEKKEIKKKERAEWSVWIGNMPYTATREVLLGFFKDCGTVTRINLPKKEGKALGFAYVDFETQEAMNLAIAHSEQPMDGRAVLIKKASDFKKTGTPSRQPTNQSVGNARGTKRRINVGKNPPSPTLFLGNLSFDVKRVDVKAAFREFGDIVGVRVATFEDNPEKCRGFGYVDFKTVDGATNAIMSPEPISIYNRRVRMEYAGEEATRKGRPWEYDPKVNPAAALDADKLQGNNGDGPHSQKKRKLDTENMAETKLQGLPVQFEGEKITFG
ncbi:Nucleolar protein 13 [Coemansia sp. RSA 1813]|nr:Nucleolar protein 13 [Coemansia sp. RSA 1646]KAJ1768156.1 Nucleolar protein 13 [Coemansia sp. RSA 1843]KAJ2093374.1 Nucleolar protein 13 [Coemansia sp. RSA 986]KAJ2217183.1 Nucleolar protein 13 [Coemansia sp. RSA 487]KAJ2572381.1 Nucleolar protein 13 [Coemansia sp. RSA 1813]